MDNTKEMLTLAVEIGDAMLRCGAEIYRVEDSVIRILEAFGLDDFDAYVLSNGIFTFILQNYGFELYMSPVSFRGSLREASLRKKK